MNEQTLPTERYRKDEGLMTKRLKWHHIYYLLAAFHLATVSFSLYLNHRIVAIYTESVQLNEEWAERMSRYAGLAQLAASVNAPGNDVFDTLDVPSESRHLEDAMRGFLRTFAAAQTDLKANVEENVAASLVKGLALVEDRMRRMVSEARLIFSYLEKGESERAGQRMAEMDRKFSEVRAALDGVQRLVREIQRGNFDRQTAAAAVLGRYQYLIGGFILLMVVAVTVYGQQLSRKMESDQRQRESVLEDLQEAEARTRAIVDTAAEGIITVDEHGTVTSFNNAAEGIFGYGATEVIGSHVSMLMESSGENDHEGFSGWGFQLQDRQGRAARYEVEGRQKGGVTFPMDLAVSDVQIGIRRIQTAIVRDLTDRKRAEALSHQYHEELEATVRERTEGLQAALSRQSELATKNAEAYEVIRRTQEELVRKERLAAVGEIAAVVAHGIRNPLASIRAAAEVQREFLDGQGALSETLSDIVTEVNRLERRIRTVLDFARPFEPNLAMDDLNSFVAEFADAIRGRIPETVSLDVSLDPAVPQMRFDRAHMHEVLEALVINGVEAVGGEGLVTIRTALAGSDGDEGAAILSVADTGPGIDPVRIERVFELFHTNKPSGTGVGLATAKRIVECHGGRIGVVSEPGNTTFRIVFPPVESPAKDGA